MKSLVLKNGFDPDLTKDCVPGALVAVFGDEADGIALRCAGFEIRDCLLVIGPQLKTVWLVRKRTEEKTLTAQLLKTGAGAFNIDACRVGENPGYSYNANKNGTTFHGEQGHRIKQTGEKRGADRIESTQGRWPSNLAIVHAEGCKKDGFKIVKAPTINRFTDGAKPFGNGAGHPYTSTGGGDEKQDIWTCTPGCPASALDEMSGEVGSFLTRPYTGKKFNGENSPIYGKFGTKTVTTHNDSGGASRFFPQFKNEDELVDWITKLIGAAP